MVRMEPSSLDRQNLYSPGFVTYILPPILHAKFDLEAGREARGVKGLRRRMQP